MEGEDEGDDSKVERSDETVKMDGSTAVQCLEKGVPHPDLATTKDFLRFHIALSQGPDHTSTLATVNNLGHLYYDQGRLAEAEAMYERALAGKEKALGPDHTSMLDMVHNLPSL